MITCKRCADLLLEFMEGSLPADVHQRVMGHLRDCPPCLRFVETYKKTTQLCRKTLVAAAPEELGVRLAAYLREATATNKDSAQK